MKTIGLIGGLTWVSTIDYYRIINEEINKRSGGKNSARIILYSVDFEEFRPLADEGKWDEVGARLNKAALTLEKAGAEMLIICSNTPHKAAGAITESLKIPFIHIAEVTSKEIHRAGIKKVALLGTRYTMKEKFYSDKLLEYNIETIVPDAEDMEYVHKTIFSELAKNIISAETKSAYLKIIDKLISRGAEGVILGCTEIPLLVKQEDSPVPVFDTTMIHANAAVDLALRY